MKKKAPAPAPVETAPDATPAQAYANRIWEGQSISLPRVDRLARIDAALVAQGFDATDIAAIVLPETAQ